MSPSAELTAHQRVADEAIAWMRLAVELDTENRQLRQWLTNMLLVVATRDELLELGRAEIEQRWPS